MQTVLVVAFLFLSVAVVVLILLQHGKGADAGAAFGSGASATVFGASGSSNFLSRATAILAAAWFALAMTLGWFSMRTVEVPGLMDGETAPIEEVIVPQAVTPAPTSADLPDIPGAATVAPGSDVPDLPAPAADMPPGVDAQPSADLPPGIVPEGSK